MVRFKQPEGLLLLESLAALQNHVEYNVTSLARQRLELMPQGLQGFDDDLAAIRTELSADPEKPFVSDALLPRLKGALLFQLKEVSQSCERRSRLASDGDTKAQIEAELAPYQLLTSGAWFMETTVVPAPVLRDYLLGSEAQGQPDLPERELDEKFGILTAFGLFFKDLAYYRFECCELRNRPVSVAFVDIDDFKKFNSDHPD